MSGRAARRAKTHTRRRRQRLAATAEGYGPDRSLLVYRFGGGGSIRRPASVHELARHGELLENCFDRSGHKPDAGFYSWPRACPPRQQLLREIYVLADADG